LVGLSGLALLSYTFTTLAIMQLIVIARLTMCLTGVGLAWCLSLNRFLQLLSQCLFSHGVECF
jgi:hypothetical protein